MNLCNSCSTESDSQNPERVHSKHANIKYTRSAHRCIRHCKASGAVTYTHSATHAQCLKQHQQIDSKPLPTVFFAIFAWERFVALPVSSLQLDGYSANVVVRNRGLQQLFMNPLFIASIELLLRNVSHFDCVIIRQVYVGMYHRIPDNCNLTVRTTVERLKSASTEVSDCYARNMHS